MPSKIDFELTEEDIARLKAILPKQATEEDFNQILIDVKKIGDGIGYDNEDMKNMFLEHYDIFTERGVSGRDYRSYIKATRFVTLKQSMSAIAAWKVLNQDVWQRLQDEGKKEFASRYSQAYSQSKVVKQLEENLSRSFYSLYSTYRHKAIESIFDLMNGKSAPTKIPIWEQEPHPTIEGKFVDKKDEYGRKIQMRDHNGLLVFDTYHQKVSPLVQLQAGQEILKQVAPPELAKDINVNVAITQDQVEAQEVITKQLTDIAINQQKLFMQGVNIDEVQKIGHYIDVTEE